MNKILSTIFVTALLWPANALAFCTGSANFYSCSDASGNDYTVSRFGSMTSVTGSNAQTGSQWSQTSNTFGNMTITNGQAANGQSWNETQTRLGGGMSIVNGTNSNGEAYSYSCNQITGCQ